MIKSIKTIILICLFSSFIFSCEVEVTTAHIENITMCTSLIGNKCDSNHPCFSPSDSNIFVCCSLNNAPNNTLVTFVWKYTGEGENIIIDEITLSSDNAGPNVDINSSLSKPYNGWPTGSYEVEINIDGNENDSHIKYFEVR